MGVVRADIQTVEDIYRLIWTAISSKQPIQAIYDRRLRLFCPHRTWKRRAIEALALLIEQHAVGMFLFWERQGERLLWCVDRGDGPKQVDFEAMRAFVQQRGMR